MLDESHNTDQVSCKHEKLVRSASSCSLNSETNTTQVFMISSFVLICEDAVAIVHVIKKKLATHVNVVLSGNNS